MEALLSLAFDNIASRDHAKIRKGIRQIEGLLAQICLAKPSTSSSTSTPQFRSSVNLQIANKGQRLAHDGSAQASAMKTLDSLPQDLAFREFFRLQEGFECNVASRLLNTVERLLGMGASGDNDLLILAALDLLRGILLLHPPSRALFSREVYMNLLLDLLDSFNPPAIQSHALLVLVTCLLQNPSNTRTFEQIDGLLTVTSLFKSPETAQSVKLQLVEFLYFYLMSETPAPTPTSTSSSGDLQYRPSNRLVNAFEQQRKGAGAAAVAVGGGGDRQGTYDVRSTGEKQRMLGRYLSNVEDLVADLEEEMSGRSSRYSSSSSAAERVLACQ